MFFVRRKYHEPSSIISESSISEPATVVIIFWNFLSILLFYQFFFSLQVKWSVIISNKNGILELPPKLPKDCSRFVWLL